MGPISQFIERHYKHFNSAVLVAAAKEYKKQIDQGKKMMIAMAGAMSTAQIGISLAEMIRQDKVHIISTTGANLEEDVFNLIGNKDYQLVPHYRHLTPEQEKQLYDNKLNRVTDTTIPEHVMNITEEIIMPYWQKAQKEGKRYFPHEYLYMALLDGKFEKYYQIDPKDSWLLAAAQKNLPIVIGGWEDSTLGNIFAARVMQGKVDLNIMKTGIEYMMFLAQWYEQNSGNGVGFFQIGGGIAGDFPICVVPMLIQDMKKTNTPFWSYFCQISDSTTSYGSYSGAVPNEKITWGKLDVDTPKFIIESDATIVAPLIFAYVLGW